MKKELRINLKRLTAAPIAINLCKGLRILLIRVQAAIQYTYYRITFHFLCSMINPVFVKVKVCLSKIDFIINQT